MIVYKDISLRDFEPWSGAVDTYNRIYNEGKLDKLEAVLEDLYPDGVDETTINDLLWFEEDTVFEWLGIRAEQQIRDELDEAKDELTSLESDYRDDAESIESEYEDMDQVLDEKIRLYNRCYREDIDALYERIRELKEELEAI